MMISPEVFYQGYLKGKTKEQIMSVIRSLKQEIGRLKNTREHPEYGMQPILDPSEDIRISSNREYLKRAKIAYVEAGGTYTLARSEEKAANFDKNIDAISKITLSIHSFFHQSTSHVIELSEAVKVYTELWGSIEPPVPEISNNEGPYTKETILSALEDLHIGEWRTNYSIERFDFMVLDGTQWDLVFEYLNGHKPVRYSGDNSFPYNFEKLQHLFGIENLEK